MNLHVRWECFFLVPQRVPPSMYPGHYVGPASHLGRPLCKDGDQSAAVMYFGHGGSTRTRDTKIGSTSGDSVQRLHVGYNMKVRTHLYV